MVVMPVEGVEVDEALQVREIDKLVAGHQEHDATHDTGQPFLPGRELHLQRIVRVHHNGVSSQQTGRAGQARAPNARTGANTP
jgi:hypothetical protein